MSAGPEDGVPRFCPFCRECFEDVRECPDHELPLVDFTDLPARSGPTGDHESLAPFEHRFGRGPFGAGALLLCAGFAAPALEVSGRGAFSCFDAAAQGALNLWTVPAAAVAAVALLVRVRTPARLRSVRLAALALPAFAVASLALSTTRILGGAANDGVEVTPAWGVLLLGTALLLLAVGALRLGVHAPGPGSAAHEP